MKRRADHEQNDGANGKKAAADRQIGARQLGNRPEYDQDQEKVAGRIDGRRGVDGRGLIRLRGRGNDGDLKIMELEMIEPSLWLQHAPDKGESFAAAIRRRADP